MGHAILERALFGWDLISGSHQGQQPQRLRRDGVSLYAKNRPHTWLHPNALQISQIPLAPRAPSIHGPSRFLPLRDYFVAFGAKRT
jgi:hypothetical protein